MGPVGAEMIATGLNLCIMHDASIAARISERIRSRARRMDCRMSRRMDRPPPPQPTRSPAAESQPLKVVVLCPLEIERRLFRRYAKLPAITIGVGHDAVRRAFAARAQWPYPQPSLVLLVGTSGALSEKYATGSDAIAREVRSDDGRAWISTVAPHASAVVVESSTIVTTPADKRALQLSSGADLVDMESFTFASLAEEAGLRWAVVRGVSDDAHTVCPAEIAQFIDARGHLRVGPICSALLRKPSLFFPLRTLQRNAHRAMRSAAFTADALGCMDAIDLCDATHPLLLYGGSFDPPHVRHASMLAAAMRALHSPCALVVPAALNPLKSSTGASGDLRMRLCRATFTDATMGPVGDVRLCDMELRRGSPSYTIDTVLELGTRHPHLHGSLRMLVGSDSIRTILSWRRWRELLTLAPPAIVLRPPDDASGIAQFLANFGQEHGFPDAPSWLLPLEAVERDSTSMRETIASGERPLGLTDETWHEIQAHELYGFMKPR